MNFSAVMVPFLAVLSLRWTAAAAQSGPRSLVLWILAALFFMVPQVYTVADLSKQLGVGEGIYGWVRDSLGPFHGFLCGWCYWVNNLIYFPSLLFFLNSNIALAFGVEVPTSFGLMALTSAELFVVGLFCARGASISNFIHRLGMIGNWIPWLALVIFACLLFSQSQLSWEFGLQGSAADLSLFSSLCFALAGFELSSFYYGDRRERPRAVWIAAGLVLAMYIVGTFSILVTANAISITAVTGVISGISDAAHSLHISWIVLPIGFMMGLAIFSQTLVWFTGAAEIPYLVGVDRYLPKAFSLRHSKWSTPTTAIASQCGVGIVFTVMATAGQSLERSYKTLCDVCLVVYFIPYIYLFIVHLKHLWHSNQPRFMGTALSILGLTTTLLAVTMSLFPQGLNESLAIAPRTLVGSVGLVAGGQLIYWASKWRRHG